MASVSRWQDRKESQLQDPWGLSQMGQLSPCRAPVSRHHVHKGTRWEGQTLDTLSAGPHSFLAKDWNGVERPGLGCPVLVVLASVIVSSFSAQVYRALWSWGWLRSCKVPPRPAACRGGHQDNAASTPVFSLWNYG